MDQNSLWVFETHLYDGTVKRLLHTKENNTINIFILQRPFLNSFFYHMIL